MDFAVAEYHELHSCSVSSISVLATTDVRRRQQDPQTAAGGRSPTIDAAVSTLITRGLRNCHKHRNAEVKIKRVATIMA